MKKLKIKTLPSAIGGAGEFQMPFVPSDTIGPAYTCGSTHYGTCPHDYHCVGYHYNDPSCGLLQTLTGTCPDVVTYECI
jgi:hypothetical protein